MEVLGTAATVPSIRMEHRTMTALTGSPDSSGGPSHTLTEGEDTLQVSTCDTAETYEAKMNKVFEAVRACSSCEERRQLLRAHRDLLWQVRPAGLAPRDNSSQRRAVALVQATGVTATPTATSTTMRAPRSIPQEYDAMETLHQLLLEAHAGAPVVWSVLSHDQTPLGIFQGATVYESVTQRVTLPGVSDANYKSTAISLLSIIDDGSNSISSSSMRSTLKHRPLGLLVRDMHKGVVPQPVAAGCIGPGGMWAVGGAQAGSRCEPSTAYTEDSGSRVPLTLEEQFQELRCSSLNNRGTPLAAHPPCPGTWPLPAAPALQDNSSHLAGMAPDKAAVLTSTLITSSVPLGRHKLTVALNVALNKIMGNHDPPLALAAVLDIGATMATTACAPSSSTLSHGPTRLEASIQAVRGLVMKLPDNSPFKLLTVSAQGVRVVVPLLRLDDCSRQLVLWALDRLETTNAAGAAASSTPSCFNHLYTNSQATGVELGSGAPPGYTRTGVILFSDSNADDIRSPPPDDVHLPTQLYMVFLGPESCAHNLRTATARTGGLFTAAGSVEEVAVAAGSMLQAVQYGNFLNAKLRICRTSKLGLPKVLIGPSSDPATLEDVQSSSVTGLDTLEDWLWAGSQKPKETEVRLRRMLAPGESETVLVTVELPRATHPSNKCQLFKAYLMYEPPYGQRPHVRQEVDVRVARTRCWVATQPQEHKQQQAQAVHQVQQRLSRVPQRTDVLRNGNPWQWLAQACSAATRHLPFAHPAQRLLERGLADMVVHAIRTGNSGRSQDCAHVTRLLDEAEAALHPPS